jgi:hypothetical protein
MAATSTTEAFTLKKSTNSATVSIYFVNIPEPLLESYGIAQLFTMPSGQPCPWMDDFSATPLSGLKAAYPQIGFVQNSSNNFTAAADVRDARAWIAALTNNPSIEISGPLRVRGLLGNEGRASFTSAQTFVLGSGPLGLVTTNLNLGATASFTAAPGASGPLLLSAQVDLSEFLGYSKASTMQPALPRFRQTQLAARTLLQTNQVLILGTQRLTNQLTRVHALPLVSRLPAIGNLLAFKRRETRVFRLVVLMIPELEPSVPAGSSSALPAAAAMTPAP